MLQIYHCEQLNALFCCLRRNVKASCHKHFVVFSRNQHRRLLPATCHNLRDGRPGPPATAFTTPGPIAALTQPVKPDIRSYRDFCIPHLHSTPPLGGFPSEYCYAVWHGKKNQKVWLPDGEKNLKICLFVFTWFTNVTETHAHTQTDTQRMTAQAALT